MTSHRLTGALAVAAVMILGACTAAAPGTTVAPSPGETTATTPPSPRPSDAQTSAPSATTAGTAPPALTESYTSAVHGITISYPSGWATQEATEPWTSEMLPFFREPDGDFIYDPQLTDHLFLGLTSQSLEGEPVEDWAAPIFNGHGCSGSTDQLSIDGASGVIAGNCLFAALSKDDRGYLILLYLSDDDPELRDVYDLEWFEEMLGTVRLDPAAADG